MTSVRRAHFFLTSSLILCLNIISINLLPVVIAVRGEGPSSPLHHYHHHHPHHNASLRVLKHPQGHDQLRRVVRYDDHRHDLGVDPLDGKTTTAFTRNEQQQQKRSASSPSHDILRRENDLKHQQEVSGAVSVPSSSEEISRRQEGVFMSPDSLHNDHDFLTVSAPTSSSSSLSPLSSSSSPFLSSSSSASSGFDDGEDIKSHLHAFSKNYHPFQYHPLDSSSATSSQQEYPYQTSHHHHHQRQPDHHTEPVEPIPSSSLNNKNNHNNMPQTYVTAQQTTQEMIAEPTHHHGHGHSGWLDMGAYSGKHGAFGWYADFPVGGHGHGHGHGKRKRR